jgi:hypothetical protein
MSIVTTKLTEECCFLSHRRENAFRVAQGRTMPFFGEDVGTKLKIL